MNVITIPKKLVQKDDLVVIPKSEYESLLKKQPRIIPVAKLSSSEKTAISQSEKELACGKYVTLGELEHELGSARAKSR
ncbi:MAG: hypothetical protein A2934_04375 [Candidatus Sungbacteria bacterium RIFCSPLOWO2_01_FULL_47_10]|uniref:Uncharacterized protein n=1 Tax=Candidatus Sungbacteria bacterium RIFCSPLOWO2_01_FULL_47_10 TaxID=1802276 RepID=A0A1G2L0D7_9BACT|nr:MAG: hypothetical protein A2934_04375 [Candidatus Sungbacteria bacterium RIFCSPLOWO2_01_FULL_47_10]